MLRQPKSSHKFWIVNGQSRPTRKQVMGRASSQLPPLSADYQTLLNELAQARSLDDERVERIYHLEQALDQALLCLEELRLHVRDQRLLETQLATTEAFSSIQQQAIARFKAQLEQQHRLIEARLVSDTPDASLLEEFHAILDATTIAQFVDLERLQNRLTQDRAEMGSHCDRLEAQIQTLQAGLESRQRRIVFLEAEALTARTQVANLQVQLDATQQHLRELQTTLGQTALSSAARGEQPEQLQLALDYPTQTSMPMPMPESETLPLVTDYPLPLSTSSLGLEQIQRELAVTQIKVEELEVQLAKQMKLEARWQHRCQELEAECDRFRTRATELDRQAVEMQEQILKQTKQAGEYEAAIQHWKDRYAHGQHYLLQIKELLESALFDNITDDLDPETGLKPVLSDLLTVIQQALTPDYDDSSLPQAVPSTSFNPLDLPDFLIRRRNYRKKGRQV